MRIHFMFDEEDGMPNYEMEWPPHVFVPRMGEDIFIQDSNDNALRMGIQKVTHYPAKQTVIILLTTFGVYSSLSGIEKRRHAQWFYQCFQNTDRLLNGVS